jgi:hypothetical protein
LLCEELKRSVASVMLVAGRSLAVPWRKDASVPDQLRARVGLVI